MSELPWMTSGDAHPLAFGLLALAAWATLLVLFAYVAEVLQRRHAQRKMQRDVDEALRRAEMQLATSWPERRQVRRD